MDLIIIFSVIVVLVAAFFAINAISENNKKKRFRNRLQRTFGQFSRTEPNHDKMKSAKGYFLHHMDDSKFIADEITWNDLEGDALFASMNKCYSSAGEEILYYMLRTPDVTGDENRKKDFLSELDALEADEKTRLDLQIIFAILGKTGKYSVFDYISLLGNVKPVKPVIFVVFWIIYLAIAAFFFVSAPFAAAFLSVFAIGCMIFYFSQKKTVERYITSFEYIVRTIVTAESVIKLNPKGFEKEVEELKSLRKELKGIKPSTLVFIKQSTRSGNADLMSSAMSLGNAFFHFDLFCFYRLLSQVVSKAKEYDRMFEILGGIEAKISVLNFKCAFENTCEPTFTDDNKMSADSIFHPLIENCVENSFCVERGMVITGSNASGKSTFLRTVLINCLLAQTVYVSTSKEFVLRPSFIFSSLSLKDSLASGESYYMAEINSIKRILNARDSGNRVICFLDEVLRGTNTVDRIAAATEILENLSGETIITFAATHDIELTRLLEKKYDNYFFREEILRNDEGKEDIYFSYKINTGISDTRNALQLLKLMGYPPEVVDKAENLAHGFLETGKWRV